MQITIKNRKYDLNVDAALKNGTLTRSEPLIKIGRRFKSNDGDEYILAHCSATNQVTLICLEDGYRWRDLVVVKNEQDITIKEFLEISGGGIVEILDDDGEWKDL